VRLRAQFRAVAVVIGTTAITFAGIAGCSSQDGVARSAVHASASRRLSLIFDGRAKRMRHLRCDSKRCSQTPAIWSGLQFCRDDITLERNVRFGQVYRYHTNARSNLVGCHGGPIWSPSVAYDSLNHLPRHQILGTVEYYRESIMLPRGFAFIRPGWESLTQYGFGPFNGAEELELLQTHSGATHFELQLNGGRVVNCHHQRRLSQGRLLDLGDARSSEGHWVDFIVGIRWETNSSGWVDVYMRRPDRGQLTFRLVHRLTGRPTYEWGTCGRRRISRSGTDPHGHAVRYMDQQNDYEGYWNRRPRSRFPSHTFLQSGLLIAPTLLTAKAAAP
jgi:hypothetical protein